MQKGFNSDINLNGKSYHVQTEDWGAQNPFVVSRIFCNGAVVQTVKTPYEKFLRLGIPRPEEVIKLAVRKQHADIIDRLVEQGL